MNLKFVRIIDIYIGIPLIYSIAFLRKLFASPKLAQKQRNYRKILFVKFWGMGNIIMLLPTVSALKNIFPDAQLDILTLRYNYEVTKCTDLFKNVHLIGFRNPAEFIFTFISTFISVKREDYDLVLDFEQFARFSAIFCSLIAKRETVGFITARQHRHFLYTMPVYYNNSIHTTKLFYSLGEKVGIPSQSLKPIPLRCQASDTRKIVTLLNTLDIKDSSNIILLHIGTSKNFILRRWPAENFAQLAIRLIDAFQTKIVLTGSNEEIPLARIILNSGIKLTNIADFTGRLNLPEFIALIKMSVLVISADTAAVHLASCINIPTVALYGPNTPRLYGPWGENSIYCYENLPCSPCINNYNAKMARCRHPEGQGTCMIRISVNKVFSEIKKSYFDDNAKFRIINKTYDEKICATD